MADLALALRHLSAYRHLLREPILQHFLSLLEGDAAAGAEFFYALKSAGCPGLGAWLWDALRYTESPYGLLCERGASDPDLENAARRDVETLLSAARAPWDQIVPDDPAGRLLPRWQSGADFTFDSLTGFYRQNGCGRFARYRAFRWDGRELLPIPDPDSPQPWELVGYERERQEVADNARALLEGRQVNHVLLYGESGTGKSATVKSLLSLPGFDALRIVELDKDALTHIPALLRLLGGRRQKFILFLDDLAFDRDDRTYSQLKTILEGSLEKRPDNVVVYATSNRRNLVRQTFSDRLGDEVDAAETVSEKTSLAERFGVRVPYRSLTPPQFLATVRELARLYHLDVPPDRLDAAARQWLLRHPGATPRTARQFVARQLEDL